MSSSHAGAPVPAPVFASGVCSPVAYAGSLVCASPGVRIRLFPRHPPGSWIFTALASHRVLAFARPLDDNDPALGRFVPDHLTFAPALAGCRWFQGETLHLVQLELTRELVRDLSNGIKASPGWRMAPLHRFRDGQLETIMSLLCAESVQARSISSQVVEHLGRAAGTILLALASGQATPEPALAPGFSREKLDAVLGFVDRNLAGEIQLSTLAHLAHLSPTHFIRLFRNSTGWTPHQFVLHRRLERAKELLLEHRLSLVEICFEVGFPNQSHFTTMFRKYVGTTPKRFARSAASPPPD